MEAPFTLVDEGGRSWDLRAEWDGPVTVEQVLAAAGITLPYPGAAVWVDGRPVTAGTPVSRTGLRPGSLVTLRADVADAAVGTDPAGAPHVAVVAGPLAGEAVALGPGHHLIGRGADAAVRLADPRVGRVHAALDVDANGTATITALGHPVRVDDVPLDDGQPAPWPEGTWVRLGSTWLEWRGAAPADAVAHPADDGRVELRRPPRLVPGRPSPLRVSWPAEPEAPARRGLPLATALAPLLLGGVLFAVSRSAVMLLFMAMSPVMAVTSTVTDRRSGSRRHRRALEEHASTVAAAEHELGRALAVERAARRAAGLEPATAAALAAGPRRRLWERRRGDADLAEVRVGLADRPAVAVQRDAAGLHPGEALPPPVATDVPVTVDLSATGVLGIAGPDVAVGRLATWLCAQLAVAAGPADVRLVVLDADRGGRGARWRWARWLPHTAAPGAFAGPAAGTPDLEPSVAALADLVAGRQRRVAEPAGATAAAEWPLVVVVADPAHDLRRCAGMAEVLRDGPSVGVLAICVESDERYLPAECRAVVAIDGDGVAVLRRGGEADVAGITVDGVGGAWCARLGRSLGRLADPEVGGAATATVPSSARLLDILDLDATDADALAEAWGKGGRSTAAVVGVAADGVHRLDLRLDGPHGLVAGTTGAGKSELLQTLVASLAVANRPDALTFLLVDYKGGSAFRDCAALPHTVGVVTDLDPHLTERALTSLGAELRRREAVLADAGAKDIDDHVGAGSPGGALPRLLIVIDEFAGLVAELPGFVSGLVGIAQRGRSLGIHLLLATQRPSGVVSPEIRANTNLRIALRVTSPSESADVIDAPDAATISPSTPGRALARTGHSSLTLFQSARVTGTAPTTAAPRRLRLVAAGAPAAGATTAASVGDGAAGPSDLARIVEAATAATAALAIAPPPPPWLPALPAVVRAGDLGAAGDAGGVALGVVDLPWVPAQRALTFDPATSGHLLVAGSAGTGRTTTLRTLAAVLTDRHGPADLWLYAIDCGGGELRRLAGLPGCGAVVTRAEPERAGRLLERLGGELTRRLGLLAAGGHAHLGELRAADPAAAPPWILVLVDRWEGWAGAFDGIDGGRLTEALLTLAREGWAAGIRLVVSGDRSLLIGKLASAVDDRLCLAMTDPADYSLAGLDPRKVPTHMPAGRAVRSGDGAEVQVAVLGESPGGAAQVAAVTARHRPGPPPGDPHRPFRVEPLPGEVAWRDAEAVVRAARGRATAVVVGFGGDEVEPCRIDLADTGGLVVAGPRRSGRSTALAVVAEGLLAADVPVLALCPRSSPLRALAGRPGVLAVVEGADPPVATVLDAVNRVDGPLGVLVDDAYLLGTAAVAELLEMIGRDGREQGHALVVAGTADDLLRPMRGFIPEARQSRTGLLLCPESHLHGEVVGAKLPRSATWARPEGRALLVRGGRTTTVQVPHWVAPAD